MNITSVNHTYQAVPPYLNNRELPVIMMGETVARLKEENPDLGEQEIWNKATAYVEENCDMIWFGLTGVSMPEQDALDRQIAALYQDYQRDKASEFEVQKRLDLVKKHVASINNLTIDGEPVTDFDTFYQKADKILVRWVCEAVHSCLIMGAAERKNFMPRSVSPV